MQTQIFYNEMNSDAVLGACKPVMGGIGYGHDLKQQCPNYVHIW